MRTVCTRTREGSSLMYCYLHCINMGNERITALAQCGGDYY